MSNCNRLIILFGLLIAAKCLAATHYVVTNGTPDVNPTDPYTNWGMAGTSIIDVVNAAMTNTEPRVVWVSNGTYYFTNGVNVTNSLTIKSVNGRSNTICVGKWLPEPVIDFYAFKIDCPAGSTCGILDGFTITNFYYSTWGQGIIRGTVAMVNRGHLLNCRIANNSMYDGGGATLGTLCKITNCIIEENRADRYGGGIIVHGRFVAILDTLIQNNISVAEIGGGIGMVSRTSGTISNCVIINNTAPDGGGIGSAGDYSFGINIISCLITGNTARGYARASKTGLGGGIYLWNDHPYYGGYSTLIKDCTIQGNTAKDSGGGVYAAQCNMKNCLVYNNVAWMNVGGVLCKTGLIENCTIVSNIAGVDLQKILLEE